MFLRLQPRSDVQYSSIKKIAMLHRTACTDVTATVAIVVEDVAHGQASLLLSPRRLRSVKKLEIEAA